MENLDSNDGKTWGLSDTIGFVVDVVWSILDFCMFFG
jgi:hypothetical protein